MKYLWIFPYYLVWHYGRALVLMFKNFKNFLFFVPRFFSIGLLLKTFFSPFQRLREKPSGELDIGNFLSVITVNMISRLFGLIIRSLVIAIGMLSILMTLLILIFIFIIWLILPPLLIFAISISLISLFKN